VRVYPDGAFYRVRIAPITAPSLPEINNEFSEIISSLSLDFAGRRACPPVNFS